MPNPHGNPDWQPKFGEPTKTVRLPMSVADRTAAYFKEHKDDLEGAFQRLVAQAGVSQLPDELLKALDEFCKRSGQSPKEAVISALWAYIGSPSVARAEETTISAENVQGLDEYIAAAIEKHLGERVA